MNASPRPVPDPARLEADVRELAVVRHPVAAPAALAAAEAYVALELGAAGLRVERQLFEWGGAEFHNVVATRDGADPARPWVVVGAHFDTRAGSPGADDNASGVAAMLEVARTLRGEQLAATVQFVGFNLEELQRMPHWYAIGSRAYARWLRGRGQRLAGALVLEMLGFTHPRQGAPPGARLFSHVPREGNFLSAVGDRRSRALRAAFERSAGRHVPVAGLTVPLKGWLLRAWTVTKGSRAPQAAGVIHTDFEHGFIRAETIAYDDYVAGKGEAGARDAGKFRLEGKEYVVQDGDVLHFRFNA